MDHAAIVTGASRSSGSATAMRLARDVGAPGARQGLRRPTGGVKDGVQVNTILPDSVMTDRRRTMLQGYADARGLSLDAAIDRFAAQGRHRPLRAAGGRRQRDRLPVRPESHWIAGTALRLDGGETKVL